MVEQGRFRADLLHRLDVVRLQIPPLRERREDIPQLAARFLANAAQRLQLPAKQLSNAALARLRLHDWPGNVRELENLCWRLAALAPGASIGSDDVNDAMPALRDARDAATSWQQALATWARAQLDAGVDDLHAAARRDFDQVLLQAALDHSEGHRGDAAHKLGLGRNTLTRKLGSSRKRR